MTKRLLILGLLVGLGLWLAGCHFHHHGRHVVGPPHHGHVPPGHQRHHD